MTISKATVKSTPCPNCGKQAEHYYSPDDRIVRISCASCDYLMVKCSVTSRVIEAYAPGIPCIVA